MMETLTVKVLAKKIEAQGIMSFILKSVDGGPLPVFTAGAHIDVYIPRTNLIRKYSLCNHPDDNDYYLICVSTHPLSRGGSRAMHEFLHEGDLIKISTPSNNFPLLAAKHSILVARGIGITPLLCMADSLSRAGKSFDLHYCIRSHAREALRDRLCLPRLASHVHRYYDDDSDVLRFAADTVLGEYVIGSKLYICGPIDFMTSVRNTAQGLGWPAADLHQEYFVRTSAIDGSSGEFSVTLARSGGTFRIPGGTSVVDALKSYGIMIPTSCEVGTCGTCLVKVVSGTCDHRDTFLTQNEKEANDQFAACCSRAKTSLLILDI